MLYIFKTVFFSLLLSFILIGCGGGSSSESPKSQEIGQNNLQIQDGLSSSDTSNSQENSQTNSQDGLSSSDTSNSQDGLSSSDTSNSQENNFTTYLCQSTQGSEKKQCLKELVANNPHVDYQHPKYNFNLEDLKPYFTSYAKTLKLSMRTTIPLKLVDKDNKTLQNVEWFLYDRTRNNSNNFLSAEETNQNDLVSIKNNYLIIGYLDDKDNPRLRSRIIRSQDNKVSQTPAAYGDIIAIYTENGKNYLYKLSYEIKSQQQEKFEEKTTKFLDNELRKITKGLDNLTDVEKVQFVYEYLAKNIVYDMSARAISSPAFVLREKKAVCIGYSSTFRYIMDYLGIPSGVEIGYVYVDKTKNTEPDGYHAWNMVKLDDGWYYLDVTWARLDNGSVKYDYFLTEVNEFKRTHNSAKSYKNKKMGSKYIVHNGQVNKKDIQKGEPNTIPAPNVKFVGISNKIGKLQNIKGNMQYNVGYGWNDATDNQIIQVAYREPILVREKIGENKFSNIQRIFPIFQEQPSWIKISDNKIINLSGKMEYKNKSNNIWKDVAMGSFYLPAGLYGFKIDKGSGVMQYKTSSSDNWQYVMPEMYLDSGMYEFKILEEPIYQLDIKMKYSNEKWENIDNNVQLLNGTYQFKPKIGESIIQYSWEKEIWKDAIQEVALPLATYKFRLKKEDDIKYKSVYESDWHTITEKDYVNLTGGAYMFKPMDKVQYQEKGKWVTLYDGAYVAPGVHQFKIKEEPISSLYVKMKNTANMNDSWQTIQNKTQLLAGIYEFNYKEQGTVQYKGKTDNTWHDVQNEVALTTDIYEFRLKRESTIQYINKTQDDWHDVLATELELPSGKYEFRLKGGENLMGSESFSVTIN